MGTPEKKVSEFVDKLRSWIPRRTEPGNLSRDFWMPDQSCRVCYECDVQFTLFNRRHHCRICGRVFCAKCTTNSIRVTCDEIESGLEDCCRVRACGYCFKQWEQGVGGGVVDRTNVGLSLSRTPSVTSFVSTKSSCTCDSSSSGTVGSYQHVTYVSEDSPSVSSQIDLVIAEKDKVTSDTNMDCFGNANDASGLFSFSLNRSDEDDYYGIHHPNPSKDSLSQDENFDDTIEGTDHICGPHQLQGSGDNISSVTKLSPDYMDKQVGEGKEKSVEEVNLNAKDEEYDKEPVDFENNGLLWLPPEPEDENEEIETVLFDEDDDDSGGFTGEWGYLCPSNSLGSREYCSRDKSSEEHRQAVKNAVEESFRSLISQLLQDQKLPASDQESWLDIITSLSWEAATLLKPDTSKGGGMDPCEYVKVKCIASGSRNESMVVKGVVCKKNVAHRRMTTKLDKPRFLILGGALEYQRVSNHLSSFDTLLQQEKDHLKMAVAKIDAHHPSVLLVEKSVSRYAQEYLLDKNITLVLNIKRPLLERIARCTGAQIVTSIDHLTSPKLGYCETFHVERFFEEHGSAGEGGKKLTKTLMFLEGCPKPLGCTILLKGANGDKLKKVKHALRYGIFAVYHLALESSFLADEGALLPKQPLKSPITVALPDKAPSIDRSISAVPVLNVINTVNPLRCQSISEPSKSNTGLISDSVSATNVAPIYQSESSDLTFSVNDPKSGILLKETGSSSVTPTVSLSPLGQDLLGSYQNEQSQDHAFADKVNVDQMASTDYPAAEDKNNCYFGGEEMGTYNRSTSDLALSNDNSFGHNEDVGPLNEGFPPPPSDSESILVSLSTRCVWKGTVCVRAHRVRIKFYKTFDKPLGRFLRDQLFDQSYRCPSCNMPSEAHMHCYTHQQGSLTISVKKLPDSLLPGEKDGKIWMWHRCLRCPRTNNFPPATRRVVMSDAAWGLSFGKVMELSFSNNAAATRVASCGHSLHRDCLRFYGYGRMIACFRYASINVHSVYLPPAKLEFNYYNQEWIQKEASEVSDRADHLFTEVQTVLQRISEKAAGSGSEEAGVQALGLRSQIMELEKMLKNEKEEFEELFRKASKRGIKDGESAIDILEINRLRRQIIFHSYVWDQRLIYAADSRNKSIQKNSSTSPQNLKEISVDLPDKLVDMNNNHTPSKRLSSSNSVPLETQPNLSLHHERTAHHKDHDEKGGDSDIRAVGSRLSSNVNLSDKRDLQESGRTVQKSSSDGHFPDSVDAAWTGEGNSARTTFKDDSLSSMPALGSSTLVNSIPQILDLGSCSVDKEGVQVPQLLSMASPVKELENLESNARGREMPFPDFYSSSYKKNILDMQNFNISDYSPVYLASFRERERQSGARLLLPVGVNETVIPVYDSEPSSVISYALVSSDYHAQMSESQRGKDAGDPSAPLPLHNSANFSSHQSLNDASETYRSLGSSDESILSLSGSRSSQSIDQLFFSADLHARVSFTDDGPLGKSRYTVTCYYAKRFEALRRICCPNELDYIRSLSRCKKWGAQGGKSNAFFAKTLDDRFIIKQVTKTELESFMLFAPTYFKYLSESIATGSPTCLAKILGIYQVSSKHLKGGKESKIDVLVMENLLFRQNISRLYDLKGSSRSRYNADTSGNNKVLLDQNLLEAMPTSPIFVGNKAKRLLERAVWNDTSFLASVDVMDYSLLVGVDEEKHELVLGIIDFIRQYTWDKHLETWVKTSGILGGPKNAPPTVISPQEYKKRFRKAMAAYFLMVLDQWSERTEPTNLPSGSKSDLCQENLQGGSST